MQCSSEPEEHGNTSNRFHPGGENHMSLLHQNLALQCRNDRLSCDECADNIFVVLHSITSRVSLVYFRSKGQIKSMTTCRCQHFRNMVTNLKENSKIDRPWSPDTMDMPMQAKHIVSRKHSYTNTNSLTLKHTTHACILSVRSGWGMHSCHAFIVCMCICIWCDWIWCVHSMYACVCAFGVYMCECAFIFVVCICISGVNVHLVCAFVNVHLYLLCACTFSSACMYVCICCVHLHFWCECAFGVCMCECAFIFVVWMCNCICCVHVHLVVRACTFVFVVCICISGVNVRMCECAFLTRGRIGPSNTRCRLQLSDPWSKSRDSKRGH